MEIKSIHQKIETELGDLITEYGFKFSSTFSFSQGSGNLYKDSQEVIFRLGYGIFDCGDYFEIGCGSISITFPIVERITTSILVKYGILGDSALNDPITFIPPNQRKIETMKFNDEVGLTNFINVFRSYFNRDALKLFEEYGEMIKVSDALNNIPQKEISNYMPKGLYKKATIWKLCGNPNYEEYIEWLDTGMTKRAKNDPGNLEYAKSSDAIKELREKLNNASASIV